ncbi:PQQ-dependent sugar dehydrogenase [Burkholderiaceae bacterium FT117]|uniref:PQQ-dependent sugar dehydrogenase n=1 Tax=Zeimonas sediminis TaxID=2944268 RepID=UPI002342F825|nr:PQQ-dependent sugar dehydrogenase [Zeimonas sediminis]MCM5569405.1 PQQ-dependent sugar dehydrogenase [Zeimonas sediminis]
MSPIKLGAALVAALGIAFGSGAAMAGPKIKLEPVVTKVNTPLAMVQPPGDNRMFVIEQFGRVRVVENGKMLPVPFLDVRSKIVKQHHDFDERGLLGIAFHPKFKENGKFYVAYSAHLDFQQDLGQMLWYDHSNVVEEYTVSKSDPNMADPSTARRITSIPWPQFNHNGHWIGFGPDGMLYISTGDGGYANDWGIGHNVTDGNGQDRTTMLGKILRIDVDKRTGDKPYGIPDDNPFVKDRNSLPEIWAYGLRNPWRCSFDTGSGALFCGDVQQNSYEEVSIVGKGQNMGWRRMEATHCFDYTKPDNHPASCDKNGLTLPILEYKNCTAKPDGCMGISVTGGYVYQGSHAAWKGKYIFGDWSKSFAEMDGQIFIGSKGADGKWTMEVAEVVGMSGKLPYILAFAQDANGEVYALTSVTTGPNGSLDTIYKIVPAQ